MINPPDSLPRVYSELANALRSRLAIIADRAAYAADPAAHLLQLQLASERIITLQGQLPVPLDGQFAHYLQRCSYDKALAWIEERLAIPTSQ